MCQCAAQPHSGRKVCQVAPYCKCKLRVTVVCVCVGGGGGGGGGGVEGKSLSVPVYC